MNSGVGKSSKFTSSVLQAVLMICLSSFIGLAIGEGLLRCAAYFYHRNQPSQIARGQKNKQRNKSLTILCIGESTTALGGVFYGTRDSYPSLLESRLQKFYDSKEVTVINEGKPGTNSTAILSSLDMNLQKYSPDVVIVMMGTNDDWPQIGSIFPWPWLNYFESLWTSLDRYRFGKLLKGFVINLSVYSRRSQDEGKESVAPDKRIVNFRNLNDPLTPIGAAQALEKASEFWGTGKYREAEATLKVGIEGFPEVSLLKLNLGLLYLSKGRKEAAKTYFSANARTVHDLVYLVESLDSPAFEENFEAAFLAKFYAEKLIELFPNQSIGYSLLATIYTRDIFGTVPADMKAEKIKKVTRLYSIGLPFAQKERDGSFFIYAIHFYELVNDQDNLNKFIKVAHAEFPYFRDLNRLLSRLNPTLYGHYYIADNMYLNPKTAGNYRAAMAKILRFGAVPIAMQYPRLSVEMLKGILKDIDGIQFIENVDNFEKALKMKSFRDVFTDSGAVVFGHFTKLGSDLVVDNIVSAFESNSVLSSKLK